MMPVNTGLTLTLPTSGCTERQHQPFAEVVTIADIKDEVELLPSLQKPKKVYQPNQLLQCTEVVVPLARRRCFVCITSPVRLHHLQ